MCNERGNSQTVVSIELSFGEYVINCCRKNYIDFHKNMPFVCAYKHGIRIV